MDSNSVFVVRGLLNLESLTWSKLCGFLKLAGSSTLSFLNSQKVRGLTVFQKELIKRGLRVDSKSIHVSWSSKPADALVHAW